MNKEVVCPEPPGDFLKFRLPLSRMSKVWAVAFPLKLRFADKDAEPVTSRAARGVVLPMPTLPEVVIINKGVPSLFQLKLVPLKSIVPGRSIVLKEKFTPLPRVPNCKVVPPM